ncbi:MAG: amidase [Alteromonadaceae bacterium]|nr:amidase [Alteromonadaceae bacterium]
MTDLYYASAQSLAQKLARGEITSERLVNAFLDRIDQRNPDINAVIALNADALTRARELDAARARGEIAGPLHGLPMTLKDVWEVVGMATTAGAVELKEHQATRNADVAQRLLDAGAVILGKTNVPIYASDIQTYNDIFGITRNPRDLERTSGGSSGGAAAAVTAGFTPVEVGSDVGGSIRIPCHYNGIFGHKPTRDIVSLRGHIPGASGNESQADLVEAGPIARTASDLAFILKVIAGPRTIEAGYWQLKLPEPQQTTLREYRIGTWFSDPHCPVDDSVLDCYEAFCKNLEPHGIQIREAKHPLLSLERILPVYFNLLGAILSVSLTTQQRYEILWLDRLISLAKPFLALSHSIEQYTHGTNEPYYDYYVHHEQREKMRIEMMSLFEEIDILLTPITPTTAIHHDHSMPVSRRRITVNGEPRPYTDQFCWIALATLLGLPSTSVPIGLDKDGMPVNIQVIGAPGTDLTNIHFAQLLEDAGLAGFQRPKNY